MDSGVEDMEVVVPSGGLLSKTLMVELCTGNVYLPMGYPIPIYQCQYYRGVISESGEGVHSMLHGMCSELFGCHPR